MYTKAALLSILLGCSAFAQLTAEQSRQWRNVALVATGAAVAATALDAESTVAAIRRGCYETNPLLPRTPGRPSLYGLMVSFDVVPWAVVIHRRSTSGYIAVSSLETALAAIHLGAAVGNGKCR